MTKKIQNSAHTGTSPTLIKHGPVLYVHAPWSSTAVGQHQKPQLIYPDWVHSPLPFYCFVSFLSLLWSQGAQPPTLSSCRTGLYYLSLLISSWDFLSSHPQLLNGPWKKEQRLGAGSGVCVCGGGDGQLSLSLCSIISVHSGGVIPSNHFGAKDQNPVFCNLWLFF